MNTQQYVSGACAICGEAFTVPLKRGRRRTRCDKHWYLCAPNKRAGKRDPPVARVSLAPRTGIAIIRLCLCCGERFVARMQSAIYCGLECFARDRRRKMEPRRPVMRRRRGIAPQLSAP